MSTDRKNMIIDIMQDIFNTSIMDNKKVEREILYNYNDIITNIEEYKIVYTGDIEVLTAISIIEDYVNKTYNQMTWTIIKTISNKYFNKNIEMTLASEEIEKIKLVFERYLKINNYPIELQNKIMSDIENAALRQSKRFTFDDISLINLIEASKGSNIVKEENRNRKARLEQTKGKDTYHFKEFEKPKPNMNEEEREELKKREEAIFTIGGQIPQSRSADNRLEKNKIFLKSYPGYSETLETRSREEIMKELITNLFENLELCYETYEKYYLDANENAIENAAVLADGTTFPFKYIIDSKRIPHMLGIPKAEYLSESVRSELSLNIYDGADKVLKSLIEYKNKIIEDAGLIEENGKTYQMLPWEKIILKTSSFMRGDYFRTCFCLVKLKEGNYLAKKEEEYARISATRYKENFILKPLTLTGVLNDLIKTQKQSKDFIFSGFIPNNGIYIPDTLITGKAENILVGKEKERLLTLQKYRDILGDNDGCQIVQRIMNENYDRKFTPEEQALIHLTTASALNIPAKVSDEAMNLEFSIQKELEQIVQKNLEELIIPNNQKRR